MANPYHPYQSEENMMNALAANSLRLEEEARRKRNAGNAALKETQEVHNSLQRREEEVKNYLQEYKLEKIRTNGDGNCFFYAMQGYGDIKGIPELSISVLEMREAVAQTIDENVGNKYGAIFNTYADLKKHTSTIRRCEERGNSDNPYADEMDVSAFSDHFHVCIVIHDWRKTNPPPYHIGTIRYPGDCDVGPRTNPNRIHILRTNENHYSLLMPIDDPEYNALKNLVESVYLPLKSSVADSHQQQLAQMANQAAVNLSGFRLNQAAASAASAAASSSALRNAPPFNILLTSEQLAQQNAILENARKRAARAASSSSSAANRPLGLGKSKASAIPLNGLNMPWECSACTFENRPNARTCEMCGASKSASNNTSRLQGTSAETAILLNGPRGKSAAADVPRNRTNMLAQAASSSSIVQQLVSNASRNLAGVVLNQQSELKAQIEKLKYQIPILKKQIEKIEKSDPKGELNAKKALLKKQEAQLEKRLAMLPKEGGTRKRRTHKRRTHKRRTHKKRTKNNRKSKRKVRK